MTRDIEDTAAAAIVAGLRKERDRQLAGLRREAEFLRLAVDAQPLKAPHFGLTTYSWEKGAKHEDS